MPLLPPWAPNLHPLVVHFPIALWVAAVTADLLAMIFRNGHRADAAATFLYPAAALCAVVAYVTGSRAAASVFTPGMAHPFVQQHANWALATTVSFAVVAAFRIWTVRRRSSARGIARILTFAFALAALVLLVQTGERGARLVFEQGVGVRAPTSR